MHPTDLDGVFDIKGKASVFFEVKYMTAQVPVGQMVLLERLVKDAKASGKKAIAIIAEHYVDDPQYDIKAADCICRKYYWSQDETWHVQSRHITVNDVMQRFYRTL